jgi:rhodanese-related sulfurtransferase
MKIYPGHDYADNEYALLGAERVQNPFLHPRSQAEYLEFVKEFFSPLADATGDGHVTLQCGTRRVIAAATPFKNIDAAGLSQLLKREPQPFLLDVREPFELTAFGAIPSVVNIPMGELMERFGEIPADKSRPIVAICQSGSRSYEIAHYLTKQGYTAVYNLEGGTSGWVQSHRRQKAVLR